MVCLYCNAPTQVVNSRLQRRSNHVWRRRKCVGCGAVFTTEEQAALHSSLVVDTGKGRLAPFSRDRLFISVYSSCKHRPSAIDDATALTSTIIGELLRMQQDGALALINIISAASTVLKRFDPSAAAVYAAYHPAALALVATKTTHHTKRSK